MKRLAFLLITVFSLPLFANEIDILTAIATKQITVETNYHQLEEKGMELLLRNHSQKDLSIKVPSGIEFLPNNQDEQPLLNIEDEYILVKAGQEGQLFVGAYCLDYQKKAPSLTTRFKLQEVRDQRVVVFLDFIAKNKVSPSNYQSGLWALLNNSSISTISPDSDGDIAFREYIAKETRRENPWYSTENDVVANPGEAISQEPVSISGELSIKSDRDISYEILVVDLTTNEEIRRYGNPGKIKEGWESNLGFKLKVKGWKKGGYAVRIRDIQTKQSLKDFPFEV